MAASERLNASDKFSVSSSDTVFMSACLECLKFLVETETHLNTMNHNYFWQVVLVIPAVAYVR